jgi:hypothetical protein
MGVWDERDEAAALNNAEWCAAIWRTHGLPMAQTLGLWFCPGRTPQYYPNVVTVDRAVDPTDQTAFIADLAQSRPNMNLSVKGSFACLDLRKAGLTPLFDAHWLWHDNTDKPAVMEELNWRRIDDERSLAAWEFAWRRGTHAVERLFRPPLLAEPRVTLLGGFDGADEIRAGGIVYEAVGALGVTNVFGSRRQLMQAVASLLPRQPIVGYEQSDSLASAERCGFQRLGPLRVWAGSSVPGR